MIEGLTVRELITALRAYPPETKVVVRVQDSGYDGIGKPEPMMLALDVHKDVPYMGPHEDADYAFPLDDEEPHETEEAVLIVWRRG